MQACCELLAVAWFTAFEEVLSGPSSDSKDLKRSPVMSAEKRPEAVNMMVEAGIMQVHFFFFVRHRKHNINTPLHRHEGCLSSIPHTS